MGQLSLRAPAKLNLYLHLTGRRADGYHLMESLVAFTQLADILSMEHADALSLMVDGEFAAAAGGTEVNLVLRAARALQAQTGYRKGAALVLHKHIPVGAGLGGGSADAAAALRGLNLLWQLGLSDAQLHALALTLGADVPMCLASTPAIARGIGELLTPLACPIPALHVLLVHPHSALCTKQVYQANSHFPLRQAAPWHEPKGADAATWLAALQTTRNHLQPAAIAVNAQVAEVLLALETLSPTPGLVRMSGSGACCFALYADASDATKAHAQLQQNYPHWFSCLTQLGGIALV